MGEGARDNELILVVEDDPELRDALVVALTTSGYRAVGDPDAMRALARLRAEEPPCMILLDLHLPGMTGLEMLSALREDVALASIPVAVMSAHQSLRRAAQQHEPVAVLAKPLALDSLLEVVARCKS